MTKYEDIHYLARHSILLSCQAVTSANCLIAIGNLKEPKIFSSLFIGLSFVKEFDGENIGRPEFPLNFRSSNGAMRNG